MKTIKNAENALFLALAIALSFVKVYKMPMGGSVTLCSMLPIMFSGIKYGAKTGTITAGMFAAYNLFFDLISGNVFVWCKTALTVIIVILFDYILPFGLLGIAGALKGLSNNKIKYLGIYVGITICISLRFICHFITGLFVWGQWANGMSVYTYSFMYNASYLLPELILTIAVSILLLRFTKVRNILNI